MRRRRRRGRWRKRGSEAEAPRFLFDWTLGNEVPSLVAEETAHPLKRKRRGSLRGVVGSIGCRCPLEEAFSLGGGRYGGGGLMGHVDL